MQAFIINLDSAKDRWTAIEASFQASGLTPVRVTALNGADLELPMKGFAEKPFRRFHGRHTNLREIGCYLSHLRAIEVFLETDDEHALICEDDVVPGASFLEVISDALTFSAHWNILRLSGLTEGIAMPVSALTGNHKLCISLGRMKGAGAYVVDRVAARAFLRDLRPMWLPFDHAFDREWCYALKAACVIPFPCSQTEQRFRSSIQSGNRGKLAARGRWLTTYPYQACNEVARWIFRLANYVQVRCFLLFRGRSSAEPRDDLAEGARLPVESTGREQLF